MPRPAVALLLVLSLTSCSSEGPRAPEKASAPAPSRSAQDVRTDTHADAGVAAVYVCPMHPEVTSSHPGTCPKCGMTLVAQEEAAP